MTQNSGFQVDYHWSNQEWWQLFWESYLDPRKIALIFIFTLFVVISVSVLIDWWINLLNGSQGPVSFSFDQTFLYLFLFGLAVFLFTSYRASSKNAKKITQKEYSLSLEDDTLVFSDTHQENKRTCRREDIHKIYQLGHFIIIVLKFPVLKIYIPKKALSKTQTEILLNWQRTSEHYG